MPKKKQASSPATSADAPPGSTLIICRNKHWRYISSFHGPWLQLPPEILDSLAHQNYTMPAPRLIDPAVFYDVVKIRKAVDEATEDAVRASTGLSTQALNNSMGRLDSMFGAPNGAGSKLSKERIFKIRQKAVKLLSRAYQLDEVAASVATMQSTSSLEDVASHVLKRDPQDTDARYVHFFHEKVPSRMMEAYTSLEPLTDVIMRLPFELQAAPLRTRAIVQMLKLQYSGAMNDLTAGLQVAQELKRMHKPGGGYDQLVLASRFKDEQDAWNRSSRDWRSVPQLKEEDQPSSLEGQMLFNRGNVHLTLACQSVHAALDGLPSSNGNDNGDTTPQDAQAQAIRLEARKRVKTYAKRALKDYTAFVANFDYTPGLPFEITNEIMRRVYDLANGNRRQTELPKSRLVELEGESENSSAEGSTVDGNSGALIKHQHSGSKKETFERGEDGWPRFPSPKIHSASILFSPTPPPDLPQFPSSDTAVSTHNTPAHDVFGTREAITYHPLLTDALHSLLLSHALLQTSPTEILRHAHNAARLARIADGYPIFQAARSPARADWIEVLRRANNWLGLPLPWQKLCAPAPLPEAAGGWAKTENGRKRKEETSEQKRERIKQESIIDALSDDRVVDEESFQKAVRARERRAMEDEEGISSPLGSPQDADEVPKPKRWAQEEGGMEYPISTDRAEAIARWIREAPLSLGKKKKRPARKTKATAGGDGNFNGIAEGIDQMGVQDEGGEEEVD